MILVQQVKVKDKGCEDAAEQGPATSVHIAIDKGEDTEGAHSSKDSKPGCDQFYSHQAS